MGSEMCIRDSNRVCQPIQEALKFIRRYSIDTLARLKEFHKMRTPARIRIIQGDARTVDLRRKTPVDGIFTSPPYVGVIDYHEQHRYAYELFNFPRKDNLEIGASFRGASKKAQEEYKSGIILVFKNLSSDLIPKAKIFIVANDKYNLYPQIGESLGYKLIDVFQYFQQAYQRPCHLLSRQTFLFCRS